MSLFDNIKKSYKEKQDKSAEAKAKELERQKTISLGKIKPLDKTEYNLEEGEMVYAHFNCSKMGQATKSVAISHQQGVASRAGCGCCLLGPLGALLGGLTAPSKTKEVNWQSTNAVDYGTMLFTNKSFIFIGRNSMVKLDYHKMLSIQFQKTFSGSKLTLKYPEMSVGEYYNLSGGDAKIADCWYEGIRQVNMKKKLKNKK
jgi:hypothetical protein